MLRFFLTSAIRNAVCCLHGKGGDNDRHVHLLIADAGGHPPTVSSCNAKSAVSCVDSVHGAKIDK